MLEPSLHTCIYLIVCKWRNTSTLYSDARNSPNPLYGQYYSKETMKPWHQDCWTNVYYKGNCLLPSDSVRTKEKDSLSETWAPPDVGVSEWGSEKQKDGISLYCRMFAVLGVIQYIITCTSWNALSKNVDDKKSKVQRFMAMDQYRFTGPRIRRYDERLDEALSIFSMPLRHGAFFAAGLSFPS